MAVASSFGMQAKPKMKRYPASCQRSRCRVWLKSVSPRSVILRKPARLQSSAAWSSLAKLLGQQPADAGYVLEETLGEDPVTTGIGMNRIFRVDA